MPILSGGPLYRDKAKPIEDYTASLGEVAGAAAQRAIDTGLGDLFAAPLGSIGQLQAAGRLVGADVIGEIAPETRITGRQAKEEAKRRGVTLDIADDGYISQPELSTVLALKERERKQLAVLDRRPKTWAGFGAELGGGLAGSLTDPAQIAASFIPIVPAARYAAWVERAGSAGGRAAVRAGIGAAEGLVGSAVLEPLVYSRARNVGLDYTAADSFMNLAFGTILGGGLHVVGGALADAISPVRRAAVEAPAAKAREALAEAIVLSDGGARVNVSPVFRAADVMADPTADARFVTRELTRAIDVTESDIATARADLDALRAGKRDRPADLVETIKSMGGIRLTDLEGRVTSEGGDVRAIFDKRYPPGLVNNKNGVPLDTVRERLQEDGWLRPWDGQGENPTSINDVLGLLSQWASGKKPVKIGEAPPEDFRSLSEEMRAAGVKDADTPDVAAFKMARHRRERAYADHLARAMDDWSVGAEVFDPMTRQEPAEYTTLREQADAAARAADDDVSSVDGEIEALGEYLDMARTREVLSATDEAALALADEFEAKANLSGRAYRAAAACMSGLA